MNPETVFTLCILFIILFLFGWYASRPPKVEEYQPVEDSMNTGDWLFAGFAITYLIAWIVKGLG